MSEAAVRIEPLTKADVAPAVELAVRVLRVKPGDRAEQFTADMSGQRRRMFVAKVSSQVVAYGRILQLAADEAGPGTPGGYYLSGVLVDPAWRGQGIATALTVARLRWAITRADEVFYVTGADNTASLRLHAAVGFREIKRFASERSAVGVDVLSQLPLDVTKLADLAGRRSPRLRCRRRDGHLRRARRSSRLISKVRVPAGSRHRCSPWRLRLGKP